MSTPPKKRGKAFWSKVEEVGEAMEVGMRFFLGFLFASIFASAAWWLGSQLWVGIGVLLSVLVFPVGFAVGFFWLEVKFFLQLVFRMFID
jgi:hypothetical protein